MHTAKWRPKIILRRRSITLSSTYNHSGSKMNKNTWNNASDNMLSLLCHAETKHQTESFHAEFPILRFFT